jgi:hypothetical protein
LVFPFLLAQDRHRRHWWSLLPIGTAALAYTLWRLRMLGAANLVSGYGDLHGADSVGDAAQSALAMGAQLGLDHWSRLLPVALLCLLALLLLAKRGDRWSVGLLMASLVAVCAPLMPLFPNIASRSLLLPTIWVYAVAAFGLQLLAQAVRTSLRPAVVLLLSGFVVLTLCSAAAAAGWQRPADSARARAEWAFMMHADSAATLVRPLGKPWYYVNVGWLRRHLGDGLEGPSLCYEPCLCARSPDKAYSAFSEGAVTRYKPDLRACPELVEAAVQVQLHYDAANGVLYWDLAPQRDGRWSYARVPVFDLAPIPRKGQTPYQLKRPTRLQFFFESSEGWTTASGVLTLDPRDIGADRSLRVGWSRGGPSSKD